jgi:retron-type reverse transcriptase
LGKIIKTKITDQAFTDMIYKYLNVGYGEKLEQVKKMPTGVIQGGTLSPLLSNIYMYTFDE